MKSKAVVLIILASFLFSCGKKQIFTEMKFLLGTEVTITVSTASTTKAYRAIDRAFEAVKLVNDLMNPYSETSDVYKINNSAPEAIEVSKHTALVIKEALRISELTGGSFDVTFGPLGNIWDFKMDPFIPPSKEEIRRTMELVDYNNIVLNDNRVALKNIDSSIGLGGIAKGYAVRLAVKALQKEGITDAVVNAGGDIYIMGSKNGSPWKSALQNPREKGYLLAINHNSGESCVTSGDYERTAFYRGKRYHHIIDPHSGYPTQTFASVTVITKDPMEADALATSIFVMGLEKTKLFLEKQSGLKVILIDLNMKMYLSKDLKDRIEFLQKDVSVEWI